jgi:hypothetical protein
MASLLPSVVMVQNLVVEVLVEIHRCQALMCSVTGTVTIPIDQTFYMDHTSHQFISLPSHEGVMNFIVILKRGN